MKIELEIGGNLRSAIRATLDACCRQTDNVGILIDPGEAVQSAFGIDFVELMEKNPELKNLIVEVVKRK